METLDPGGWARMFASCRVSAYHLEMRDTYGVAEEAADIQAWREGRFGPAEDAASKAGWLELMREATGRGVSVRRARIVSEPVSEYIRFEHAGTPQNIAAGEDVRWLPRTRASALALPGSDFWLLDRQTVLFNHFTGDGGWLGHEVTKEPRVTDLCADAFEDVWELAIPHGDYVLS